MPRDHTKAIEGLSRRKSECEAYIAGLEALNDGVDRSGAIASERKNLASYEKQIETLTAEMAVKPKPVEFQKEPVFQVQTFPKPPTE